MSEIRDLPQLFQQCGIQCVIVSQSRWVNDESEMLLLVFPNGQKRYIKPEFSEFSTNEECWLEAGTFPQVNRDFVPDIEELLRDHEA